MKNTIYLLFLFTSFNLISQDLKPIKTVEIDFKTKKIIKIPADIKKGNFYQIHIKNINLNKWNINHTAKDTIKTSPLKTPSFEDFSLDNLTTLVSNFNSFVNVQSLGIKDLNSGEKSFFGIKKGGRIKNSCENLGIYLKDSQSNFIDNFIISDLNDSKGKYDEISFRISMYKYELLKDSPVTQTYYSPDNVLIDIKDIRTNLNYSNIRLDSLKKEYNSLINLSINSTCLSKNEDLKKLHQKNLDLYSSVEKKIVEFKEKLSTSKIDTLIRSVMFLKNGINEYTSFPIQFNGEEAELKISFEPKKEEYNEQTHKLNFSFPNKSSKNYWSLGASFFASTLNDERYSTVGTMPNDSTMVYSVVSEISDKYELGTATLLRFGNKISSDNTLGFHGSFGVGVNIGKTIRPRLLLGGGFSKGKKHSIAVDFGLIAGYVDVKSNAVDLNTTYAIKPENLTVTKLKVGGFISLGYLFRL